MEIIFSPQLQKKEGKPTKIRVTARNLAAQLFKLGWEAKQVYLPPYQRIVQNGIINPLNKLGLKADVNLLGSVAE